MVSKWLLSVGANVDGWFLYILVLSIGQIFFFFFNYSEFHCFILNSKLNSHLAKVCVCVNSTKTCSEFSVTNHYPS